MKILMFILFISSAIATTNFNPGEISKALASGNAEELAKYFDVTVEIGFLDDEGTYSKANAKKIVTDFFTKHKVSSYNQVRLGVSKNEDSQYIIGNLKADGSIYRVYIYMKVTNEKYIIQELRFDKE